MACLVGLTDAGESDLLRVLKPLRKVLRLSADVCPREERDVERGALWDLIRPLHPAEEAEDRTGVVFRRDVGYLTACAAGGERRRACAPRNGISEVSVPIIPSVQRADGTRGLIPARIR